MTEDPKSTNIVWHEAHITQTARETLAGHKGAVLWFTGLSGSGKSTIANAVEAALHERGCKTYVLDGDNIRHGLNKNLGFSDEDRTENIRRIGEVTKLFCDAAVLTLTAFISPFQSDRDAVRALTGDRFIEVFVNTPIEICEQRDPKGLYEKARAGEIPEFTGITSPYEAPESPEIDLHTDEKSIEECAQQVVDYLIANQFISA
jgi:adenylylsulfate kinase